MDRGLMRALARKGYTRLQCGGQQGGQGRDLTADAGLFRALIICIYNYLQDFVGRQNTAKYG